MFARSVRRRYISDIPFRSWRYMLVYIGPSLTTTEAVPLKLTTGCIVLGSRRELQRCLRDVVVTIGSCGVDGDVLLVHDLHLVSVWSDAHRGWVEVHGGSRRCDVASVTLAIKRLQRSSTAPARYIPRPPPLGFATWLLANSTRASADHTSAGVDASS